jgi:hypothetical protein
MKNGTKVNEFNRERNRVGGNKGNKCSDQDGVSSCHYIGQLNRILVFSIGGIWLVQGSRYNEGDFEKEVNTMEKDVEKEFRHVYGSMKKIADNVSIITEIIDVDAWERCSVCGNYKKRSFSCNHCK